MFSFTWLYLFLTSLINFVNSSCLRSQLPSYELEALKQFKSSLNGNYWYPFKWDDNILERNACSLRGIMCYDCSTGKYHH